MSAVKNSEVLLAKQPGGAVCGNLYTHAALMHMCNIGGLLIQHTDSLCCLTVRLSHVLLASAGCGADLMSSMMTSKAGHHLLYLTTCKSGIYL